jgi:hypothetical protein
MSRTQLGGGTREGTRQVEAHASKVSPGLVERSNADVFQENESWVAFADDAGNCGPEVSFVVFVALFSRDGEGLTRESRSDEIHDSTPWSRLECSEVSVDRSRVKSPLFHASCQDRGCIGFPLHIADDSRGGHGKLDPEVEPPNPGTYR